MKQVCQVYKKEIQKFCNKVSSNENVCDIQIDGTGKHVRVYTVQDIKYISVRDISAFLANLFHTTNFTGILNLVEEVMNIYMFDNNGTNKLEVCRIDQIDDHILNLFVNKFGGSYEINDNSFLQSIDTTTDKERYLNRSELDQNTNINNLISSIVSKNNFIDTIDTSFLIPKKDKSLSLHRRNLRKVKDLKDRPFVCQYIDCKRAFKRYEHLKRHNKMHTGERPYKCVYPGCAKTFARSDNLSQHFKTHKCSSWYNPNFKPLYKF